jgi:aminoglycoside phosphotransferase (APT) family kinase protein
MLPPDVAEVVREAFGETPVSDTAVLSGGLSGASLFSVTIGGTPWVVRRGDPKRIEAEVACMRIASGAGVAPAIRHADVARGVVVMEKIAAGPLQRAADRPAQLARLAAALRALHAAPPFPRAASMLEVLRTQGFPPELFTTIDEAERVMARFGETASCHRDLNPNNILDDGTRVVFVDWEVAGLGDPFVDLAQLGVFTCAAPDERAELLRLYLGRAPDAREEARARIARVIALAAYAIAFHFVCKLQGKPLPAAADAVPLPDMYALLGRERERASPAVVGASLRAAAEREAVSDGYRAAVAALA